MKGMKGSVKRKETFSIKGLSREEVMFLRDLTQNALIGAESRKQKQIRTKYFETCTWMLELKI